MSYIIGITPARGGSKGIPRKNIKPIAGKPLIAWSIEAALRSKLINRYIVSTEDDEIAKIAKGCGAEVLPRPDELSGDNISTLAVLKHVVEKIPCDIVVLLQATSPIRDEGLIDSSIKRFLEKDTDSLATGFICKYTEYGKNELRRQDIKGFFHDDGNLYVIRADLIRNGDRYGNKREQIILDREQQVDIDEEFDFWMAEQILLKRSHEKK